MDSKPRILLVDDEPDVLVMYRELLGQLPSQPEIHTAISGSRAVAMLEADRYRLLICDLGMPKMDGLQVLSIVRRNYPQLRTVALTAVPDEQFRSRAYALGVDLFWVKPATEQEIKMFLECLESLLGREIEAGFRGVQSKSLMDIVQLECISQSSSVLRISNGPLTGRIWIQEGELVDAEVGELQGEAAFQRILSWRTGGFETLAAEPGRPRSIFKSYNALLLESAQAQDEARSEAATPGQAAAASDGALAPLTKCEGVEFVLTMAAGRGQAPAARGLENPEQTAAWAQQNLERFRTLGERLQAGSLQQLEGFGPQRHVVLTRQGDTELCVGWNPSLSPEAVREGMRKLLVLWAS
jgi:CheY-like chemotaxis protein